MSLEGMNNKPGSVKEALQIIADKRAGRIKPAGGDESAPTSASVDAETAEFNEGVEVKLTDGPVSIKDFKTLIFHTAGTNGRENIYSLERQKDGLYAIHNRNENVMDVISASEIAKLTVSVGEKFKYSKGVTSLVTKGSGFYLKAD